MTSSPTDEAVRGVADPFFADRFADLWDDFTECVYQLIDNIDDFLDAVERLGLVAWVQVDDDALDDPFASEHGIEPGGMMYQLTAAGLARYQDCRAVKAHLEAG